MCLEEGAGSGCTPIFIKFREYIFDEEGTRGKGKEE